MKKLIVISITVMYLVFVGCEKHSNSTDSITSLKLELKRIAASNVDVQLHLDPCNVSNPYDVWGNSLYIGITKLSIENPENFGSILQDKEILKTKLVTMMSDEYFTLDTIGVDFVNVKLIGDEFLDLFINKSVFEAVCLSKKMEDCVLNNKDLNQNDKAYLLKFVSLIRYSSYLNHCLSESLRKGTFDRPFKQCWRESLQAIQDGGPFQKLACVIDWPMCLAIIAGDCAYESL